MSVLYIHIYIFLCTSKDSALYWQISPETHSGSRCGGGLTPLGKRVRAISVKIYENPPSKSTSDPQQPSPPRKFGKPYVHEYAMYGNDAQYFQRRVACVPKATLLYYYIQGRSLYIFIYYYFFCTFFFFPYSLPPRILYILNPF